MWLHTWLFESAGYMRKSVEYMRAIAGTDENILISQDVWLEGAFLFCFNKSLHYLGMDDRALFW